MATKRTTAEFLLEQVAGAGDVAARRLFGGFALYCDSKVVGLICDDELFLKSTPAGIALLGDCEARPPYPGGNPWPVVPGERWEERDWMAALIRATADALPKPGAKRAKKKA